MIYVVENGDSNVREQILNQWPKRMRPPENHFGENHAKLFRWATLSPLLKRVTFCTQQKYPTYDIAQGHPTDRFGKLSVRKALNSLQFSEGNFHLERSWYGKLKALCFRIGKNVVSGTEERAAKIFGKEITPKVW